MKTHDVIILGAGPAGLSAAAELKRLGVTDIIVIDRETPRRRHPAALRPYSATACCNSAA